MEKENLKKGILFGMMGTFIGSFNPIIANSRPMIIDAYLFAALTVIVQAVFFFPLMIVERGKLKSDFEKSLISLEQVDSFLNGYKKNVPLLIFAGISFGVCFILFYIGYELAGAINGNLVLKTTIFFSLLFDWLILQEKISPRQVIFSIILFFGLFLAVTQGSFALLELNIGIIVLLSVSGIWMFTHAISKPMLDRKEITSIQLVCVRNFISSVFLISTYFIFFPLENINLLLSPTTIYWGVLMGSIYGIGLYLWYKSLEYINVSKATIMVSGNLIFTAIFASLILGENFTIYHLMGTVLIIISIFLIINPMKKEKIKIL